jgi:hypothetical protein
VGPDRFRRGGAAGAGPAGAGRAARDADDTLAYLDQHGIRSLEVYQPGDRFWTFQLIEAGLLVTLAAVLLGVAVWPVHRRTG